MDLEQTFDTIVFGRLTPKLESCLGLFLSPDVLYLSEVRLKDGKPAVSQLLRVPIMQQQEASKVSVEIRTAGSLNLEALANPGRLMGALKPALDQLNRHSSNVILSLSSQFCLLRYFTIPPMDRRFWRTAVPAEARKLIPIPFTELVYDYQIRPIASKSGQPMRYEVLFGVVHRSNLEGLGVLVEKLGLKLLGIELAPCSVQRLWDDLWPPESNDSSYASVHLEGGDGYVVLSQGGWPTLFRMVPLTPEAGPVERRKVDLSGSVDFASKQLGARPPTQIRLSGTNRDLKGWGQALTQEMGMPVRLLESAKMMGLKSEEWGAYACAGGALRYVAPTALTLDMRQYGRVTAEDRRAAYTLFSLVGIAAAVMTMIGTVRFVEGLFARNELSHLHRQINTVQEFRNKNTEQIQALTKEVEGKVDTVGAMAAPKPSLTEILQIIQEDIPPSVWISNLTYASPVGQKRGNGGRTLELHGSVAVPGSPADQEDMANQFRQKLQGDERFGKFFYCGTPAIEAEGMDSSKNAPAGKTTFSISCGGKAG